MKKSLILLSLFCLVGFSLFGQGNMLYSEIQQAKERNIYFENAALPKASPDAETLKNFINPEAVSFLGNLSLDLKNDKVKAMNLLLPLNNEDMILELIEAPEDFYDYVVTTSDGAAFLANKDIKHYRGIIKDDPHTLVAITFYEDEIMGLICTEAGNFNIAKDQQSNKHIFYNDRNLKEQISLSCGTVGEHSHDYEPEVLLGARSMDALDKKVRFYVETEYDIFQSKQTVTAIEVYISGLFNQVAVMYQNENIFTGISELHIWTSEDPYTGGDTGILLMQFQNHTTAFNGDLGILLTFRNIGGGQAAGFSGLCNYSAAESLSVAMVNSSYTTFPVYSWTNMVVTHELGHLFGSRHTHACVWNGNNTAIDGCAGYVEGYCSLPGNPPGGGTIMSYCHGQSVGINFSLGFGEQPGNVIRNRVNNANCLLRLILEVMDIRLPDGVSELNAGETSDIYIYLKNIGDDTALDLIATLTSDSPYLIINESETQYYGYLAPEQYKYKVYNVTLTPDTPAEITEIPVTITTTDESGRTLGIDAILHFQNTGETPQSCNPIEELTAEVVDRDIKLAWTAPSPTPEKYIIYCNGLFLRETTTTTYTHADIELGIYHYCIEALSENGCSSEPACIEVITPCNVVTKLTIATFVNGYRLTWSPTVKNVFYKVYRNSELIAEVAGNGYSDTNVQMNIPYCYTVIPVCPDDAESEPSNEVCVGIVGIDELGNDIKIYPNPVSGELQVTGYELQVENIEIYNIMGEKQKIIFNSQLSTFNSIDVSHLPAGVYFLKIADKAVKFIKQ